MLEKRLFDKILIFFFFNIIFNLKQKKQWSITILRNVKY